MTKEKKDERRDDDGCRLSGGDERLSSPDWLQCAKHTEINTVNINHIVLKSISNKIHILLETNVYLLAGDWSVLSLLVCTEHNIT